MLLEHIVTILSSCYLHMHVLDVLLEGRELGKGLKTCWVTASLGNLHRFLLGNHFFMLLLCPTFFFFFKQYLNHTCPRPTSALANNASTRSPHTHTHILNQGGLSVSVYLVITSMHTLLS